MQPERYTRPDLSPIAESFEIRPSGIALRWRDGVPEPVYLPQTLRWTQIRSIDLDAAPPEIVLRDGRRAWISAVHRDALGAAALDAGVELCRHYPIWSRLLEPFLDTDWGVGSDRELVAWGFDPAEIARIRRRARWAMVAMTRWTWEWVSYCQADLITARYLGRPASVAVSGEHYRRFRERSDRIAARGPAGAWDPIFWRDAAGGPDGAPLALA
jgi:hypothetical protein